ncbi:DUF2793 domain-containing protein [Methylocystis echinoides]|uniref:Glycine-rich domain-containing protein n=1 Tax=Methylocystis echinoides TaxID=29468 RepID=A0A9W6GS41_9HYPH|nr:DUF2793 domain-containing protein [Methylocystis echinoides]GLI92053.1 hypothetical protein LMG27198_10450 [Methylocystis echinoides]
MTETSHLALPLLDAAQAQKHVTHNEALSLIDALVHLSVSARNITTPPASPSEGDRLLIGPGATGAFAGKEKQIASFLAGAWTFLPPRAGWRLHVAAESLLLFFDGANWVDLGVGVRELQNLTRLGVGTSADQNTPLAAKLNSALFTAKRIAEGGAGDLRLSLNKEGESRTVSQIYQSDYSGRAEVGLAGDDNFRIKVSADGAQWRDSLVIDRATGAVSLPNGGPAKIVTFAASAVYTPSPGVCFVDVILFGGGGGGGGGAKAAAGVAAVGGGGGGGGGWARGMFPASVIGASQPITIGAGGAGGTAQATNSTAGANGASGGETAFGTLLRAFGGGGGSGGGLGVASGGGGGGNHTGAGTNASAATAGSGPGSSISSGGSGATAATVTAPNWSSGGGGAPASGAAGSTGGVSYFGASGGGSGGGISVANAVASGGAGGRCYSPSFATVGVAGAASGAINGGAGPGNFASATGALSQPGGGGGGGVQNNGAGGAGGRGGAGFAVIIEFF